MNRLRLKSKESGDVAFCPGGFHESRNPYLPIGTRELVIIEELGEYIESICRKYQLPVSDSERNKLRRLALAKAIKEKNFLSTSTRTLYDYDLNEDWTDILENSRNNTLFDRARKYYRRNKDLILSDDTFRKIVHSWNKKYCKPPLPEFEVNGIL